MVQVHFPGNSMVAVEQNLPAAAPTPEVEIDLLASASVSIPTGITVEAAAELDAQVERAPVIDTPLRAVEATLSGFQAHMERELTTAA